MSRTFRHRRIPLRLFGAALAAATSLPTPRASASIDIHWINTRTNGDWNTASNWNLGRVPTADDDAYLSFYNPPLPVTLSADAVARSLTIGNNDRLDTTGHRLDVTGAIRVVDGDNGLFVGPGSTVTAASLSLALNNGGQITLADGVARFGDVVTNSYPASAIAGQGTLDITGSSFANPATPWTNAGKVNVAAGGTLTLNTPAPWRSTGTISLADGSSLWGSRLILAGRLDVAGTATLAAPVSFTSGANVVLSTAVPTTLSLAGPITYSGGQFVIGATGTIRQDNAAEVVSSAFFGNGRYDWDGASGTQTTTIRPGALLTLQVNHIQDAGPDTFHGTLNLGGALNITLPAGVWDMTGTLNMTASAGAATPLVSGSTMRLGGALNVTDTGSIAAPMGYATGAAVSVGPVTGSLLTLTGRLSSAAGQTLVKRGFGEFRVKGAQSHGLDSTVRVDEGTLRLQTDAGGTATRTLNLVVGTATSPATALFEAPQHLRSLTLTNGKAALTGARLVTESLTIDAASGAQLDLNAGPLVVDYTPGAPSPLAGVRASLASGYRGGAWDGPGIVSSTARTTPGRALGYGEAADVLHLTPGQTAPFLGETVDATAVLVRLTAPGDATLDGVVNFDDLLALAKNYNRPADAHWFQGDFNYDGHVNFDDLLLLAKNYDTAAPADAIPGAAPAFAADVAGAFAPVPEPAAAGLLVAAASGFALSARRRRRRRPFDR